MVRWWYWSEIGGKGWKKNDDTEKINKIKNNEDLGPWWLTIAKENKNFFGNSAEIEEWNDANEELDHWDNFDGIRCLL